MMGARRRAAVVVLGDLGRSPRMQYHALSLANQVLISIISLVRFFYFLFKKNCIVFTSCRISTFVVHLHVDHPSQLLLTWTAVPFEDCPNLHWVLQVKEIVIMHFGWGLPTHCNVSSLIANLLLLADMPVTCFIEQFVLRCLCPSIFPLVLIRLYSKEIECWTAGNLVRWFSDLLTFNM